MAKEKIWNRMLELQAETVAHRRHLHQYPEVGFNAKLTEAYILKQLKESGIAILETKWGVVGLIPGRDHENIIGLRADMDGLEIAEQNACPYCSKIEGRMHACGHDGHMAMLLTAGKVLQENQEELPNDILLIFQPSEEGPYSGAKPMSEELRNMEIGPKMRKISALHVTNEYRTGDIGFKFGSAMASTDNIDLVIKGKGGHAGIPHESVDALSIGCKVINQAESYITRRANPNVPLTLSFGEFHSGKWRSIVNEESVIKGVLRCHSEKDRANVKSGLCTLIEGICQAWGASCSLSIEEGVPPVLTDRAYMAQQEKIARDAFGDEHVIVIEDSKMTAEDFSFFGRYWPIVFAWIGTGNPRKGCIQTLHSPAFDLDEDGLLTGAIMHGLIALNGLPD